MHYMLRGYSFKLRPNSHAPGTVGSVITNGLLINRYSHSIKLFDEKKQDWLVQNFRLQQLQRLDTTQTESPFLLFSQEEHIRRVCSQGGQLHVGVCMNSSTQQCQSLCSAEELMGVPSGANSRPLWASKLCGPVPKYEFHVERGGGGGFCGLISFVAYSWNRILHSL